VYGLPSSEKMSRKSVHEVPAYNMDAVSRSRRGKKSSGPGSGEKVIYAKEAAGREQL